jgi:hypothetical protein
MTIRKLLAAVEDKSAKTCSLHKLWDLGFSLSLLFSGIKLKYTQV